MKYKPYILRFLIARLLIYSFIATTATAATITTTGSGNWSSTTANAPWPGGTIPAATDDIVIGAGFTLTVDGNYTCNSMTIGNGSTLTVNSGILLTVTTSITSVNLATANATGTISGAGSIAAATLVVGNNTAPTTANATRTHNLTSTIASLTLSSTLTIVSRIGSSNTRIANGIFTLSSGTVTVGGGLTTTNANAVNNSTFTMASGSQNGTLVLGNATPVNLSATGTNTITFNGTGATVNYGYGGAQTVYVTTYENLTLSGSGGKTFAVTTVTGNLTLGGTATVTTGANLTVGGNLNIGDGTSFAVPAYSITVAGTTIVGGGTSGTLTISSATGTKTFTGLVTINVGATWNNTANEAITFQGGITNNGTFTAGTGVQTFSTNAQSLTGTLSIPSVTVTGVTLTNNGTLTITTALAGTGGLTNAGTLNINFTGAAGITTLTATANGNTVNYGYAGTQTVFSTNYYNLTLSSSGVKTLQTGTTTIGGNLALNGTATTTTVVAITVGSLVVGDGTGLTVAGFNLTVNGTTIVGGGTSGTLTISSATGTKTFTGLVTINVGATWNNTANEAITFQGGITNNGTFTAGTGVQTFSTNAQSLTGTLSIPSVTVTGVTLTNNGTLTVTTALAGTGGLTNAGTLNINFTGAAGITTFTATANGNTVSYGYAGTQTLRGVTYYNLTLAGSGAKTMTGVSTINGNFTLAGSATAAAAAGLTIGGTVTLGTGTTFTGGAYNHNVAGDWTNNGGTFTATGSTVNLDGTSPQTIDGTNGSGFNNLTINNASGISLGAAVSVAGTLTLTSGVLTTSSTSLLTITNTAVGSITGASVTSYVNGPLAMTLLANVAADGTTYSFPVGETGNFRPLDLVNIRTGATAPVVRVTISGTGASTGDGTTITSIAPRNWYVQVTTGNFTSATIRLTESGLIPTNVIGQSAAQSGNYVSIGGTSISTSVTSVQSVSSFPVYFAIGISSIKPLYSYQSGNWDSTTTWTTDPSGTLWINPRIPGTMDNVVILNARTISISVNAKKVVSLTIISGGILDIKSTTGHNFGTVAGQGKIMLSSNSFPGGTFTSFVASNGGTVEYYNLNNVPISTTQFTYNNLIISDSSGTISAYLNNGSNPTTYTINGNFSLKNYSSGTNTFYFGNPTASDNLINMTIYGNFSVDAGCNIRVNNFATSHAIPNLSDEGATAYLVHSLSVYGSFTNNGSVRFTGLPSPVNTAYYTLATTATGGINYGDVQVFFYGAANNTIVCNGTTDFFRLIVAKGSDETYILEVSSSNTNNFALYGPNFQGNNAFNGGTINGYGYGAYYKALFIHYGTLKLDANISIPSLTEGGQDFNVIPTAGLWINGATVSTTVTGLNGTGYQAATLYGSLRISAGQFSTGDAAGIVLGTLGTPMILIEGTGVLDVSQAWTASGGSNLMSYIQTGGTANIRLQGENHAGPMLGLSSPNASFVMSGGTLNFNYNAFIDATTDYAIMDVESQTGYYQVTGGTVNLNLPSSATAYTANSTVPFYNLNILNKTGTGTTTIQWNTPGSSLNVLNNLTIGSNAVLNLNTSSISLSVGNSFTISSGGTYTPGAADTTIFNGSGYQAFTNAGTITGGLASLTVTNSSSTTIISNNVTVNGTLTIGQNAVLNDSGKTVSVAGNISNSGKHISNSTAGGIVLTGTAAQTISGSGTGIFNNLTLNKTAGSVTVSANMTVTGNLRLAGTTTGVWNILNIGSYNLSLGTNAVVYSDASTGTAFTNNRMIQTNGQGSDGGVSKTLSNTSAFSFPFGFYNALNTTYYYMPQSIQFSSAPTTYGTVTTRPVNARDPFAQSTNSLACYWKTTSTGFTGIPLGSVISIYYYNDYFVSGTEANYIPAVFGNSIWHYINNTSLINTTTDLVSYNAADSAGGDYTAGQIAAFNGTIYTYYSIANGPWNAISTWSLTRGGPPASAIPVAGNIVVVCSPYIVTTTAAAASGSLTIETGATLDLGNVNGHSFGSIPACGGTLRIASSGYFPTGDWGNFLGTSGGTVGYYQTAALTLNLPTTYTLPNGSSANITSYCNLITLPYSGSNIILPNTNLTIYKNFTVGYSPGGGTTNCTTQLNPGATATVLEVHGITTVNQYGILQYMNNVAQIVIADSDVNIANGGTLKVRYGGNSVANTLTVYGNIINNGRFDLDSNTTTNTYYSSLQFTGSFGKSFSGTAARTHLYNIIMNKGATLDSIVNVSVDTTGFLMGSGGLSLQNGTFRLTSAVTMALSSGGFTIPVTGGLSANGGTFNIVTGTTSADLTLKGRLEVLSGTVNVGPAISSASTISSSIVYSAAGSPTISISGGTLNVFSQVRRDTANNSGSLSYTQTGGAVTVGARNPYLRRAAFEDLNTGSSFVMSNGTLIIASGNVNATSPYDLDLEPDISKVTGGTIQFGLSGVTTSQTSFRFETSIPLWNVMLDATTNAAAIQEVYNSTISGNLTIGGGSSYYNANGLDLEIGGNLINNNTDASIGPNVGGFQSQSLTQTTSFLGSTDQTITGTSSNRTNFANLEIATSSGDTVFLSNGTSSVVVNGDLTLTSGTLNDGGNSIYLLNDVDNNAAHVSPNANSGGMIFSGASNQGMTGSGSGIFGNIEINNGGNGVNMTDNSTINGRIKFTKGYLYIDDYALTLGLGAAVSGTANASNLILLNGVLSDKGVTKIFPTGASTFALPIGANGKYTPASFSFSLNGNTGASIKVIPVDGLHPSVNTDSVSDYLDYYWYVSTTGFSSAYSVTHTYTYATADTVGTPAHIERYDNSTSKWSTITGSITPPTFSFTSSSLLDGSYTIGDAFVSLPMLYSIMSGSWFNASLWATDTSSKVPYGKIPKGNPVYIRAQDSVALTANSANAASVVINGVLDAQNTTFHNIGQVSGGGKIRISSTSSGFFAFPGGTCDAFFANSASTVEFYGSINGRLPLDPGNTTKPYQNVIFSGTSIKYISSVDIKINGNLTINSGGRLDNTQYNKNVYVLGNWTDNNVSTAGFAPGNGTVYFSDSAEAQRIIMASGTMTETFYDLAINNTYGVTISPGNVAVSDQLILISGNITTSSSDTLTITNTDTGAIIGGGVNSFVNGPLRKQILNGSSFQFPVGDAVSSGRSRFGYVSVRNTSTSGAQMWSAQFFDKNATTDGYNISNFTSPLKSVVYNEYWKITGPTGGTASVRLSWDEYTGMSSSLATRALSMVAEWGTPVASSWNSVGNVVSDFGQDSGTVATSALLNLAGTQVFTIGASTAAIAALITSIQTGLWNNPGVWNVGRLPTPIDTVVITSPYTVALDTPSTVSRFAVNSGGQYNDSTFTLTVTGNVALNGTWTGSGKLSLITSGDTLYGTGAATGNSTLEIAGGSKNIASSANLILKIVSILSGDTLNNYGNVTIDSLTGGATTSVFNNLSGATLTINGSMLATGTLNAAASPNTVIYDGSVSQAIKPTTYCNVILSGSGPKSINNGSTTINGGLELSAGTVLTIQSGASVATAGAAKIVLDTNANYINLSSSAPKLQVLTGITGQDGWRMLSAPDTVTVGSMFGGKFVTQGFNGSTYPALQPNLLWWDETSQGTSLQAWRQPSYSTDTVKLGRGYMFYVFNGAKITGQPGNYSDTLPLIMYASGAEHPLTAALDFGVTATTRSPGGSPDTTRIDTNYADYGWNLVGNPTPSTINWNASSGWTKSNMDGTIYVWDPNDTTGGYKTWNGTTGNLGSGLIAPFQAFWVKANASSPSLKCDNGVKTTGGSFLENIAKGPGGSGFIKKMADGSPGGSSLKKTSEDSASSTPVLSLNLSANGLQTRAYLMFSNQGKLTYDPYDAFSLVPLSTNYLILYTVAGESQPAMQIQNLPDTGFSDPFTLPLYVGGTVGSQPLNGSFTLSWKLNGRLPTGWNITLMDDAAQKAYTMSAGGELTFQYNTPTDLLPSSTSFLEKNSGTASNLRTLPALPWPVVQTVPTSKLPTTASVTPRFRLMISTNNDLTGYLPSTPELQQNYPNPFNPSTNIGFSVPAPSRVTIEVFNILGQKIATVADRDYATGKYVVTWNPRQVGSGVYLCRMIVGNHKQTIKMVLLR